MRQYCRSCFCVFDEEEMHLMYVDDDGEHWLCQSCKDAFDASLMMGFAEVVDNGQEVNA